MNGRKGDGENTVYDRALLLHGAKRNDVLTLEEVQQYGVDSFADAENEASLSRIYAGQHFRSDENAGETLGSKVADFVVDNFLTRVHGRDDGDGGREGRDN